MPVASVLDLLGSEIVSTHRICPPCSHRFKACAIRLPGPRFLRRRRIRRDRNGRWPLARFICALAEAELAGRGALCWPLVAPAPRRRSSLDLLQSAVGALELPGPAYAISTHDCRLATMNGGLAILDEIARLKGSDAIFCQATSSRISLRGWPAMAGTRCPAARAAGRSSSDSTANTSRRRSSRCWLAQAADTRHGSRRGCGDTRPRLGHPARPTLNNATGQDTVKCRLAALWRSPRRSLFGPRHCCCGHRVPVRNHRCHEEHELSLPRRSRGGARSRWPISSD